MTLAPFKTISYFGSLPSKVQTCLLGDFSMNGKDKDFEMVKESARAQTPCWLKPPLKKDPACPAGL